MNKNLSAMDSISVLENRYLEAKRAYYSGNPIMLDEEFDDLEEVLLTRGSSVVEKVGSPEFDRNSKVPHPSPMSSLGKVQFRNEDPEVPLKKINSWFETIGSLYYEATPKFDGNAMNLVYVNGILSQAISRGDGTEGREQVTKMRKFVPNTIPISGIVEIRGEIMIPVQIFQERYSEFKNPRNFVAGMMNRDDADAILDDLVFVAYEIRVHSYHDWDFPDNCMDTLSAIGFNTQYPVFSIRFHHDNFLKVYDTFKDYRKICPFQLDGFVIKAEEESRKEIGEKEHHPLWAIAIKFPPVVANSTVIGIEWNMGKTGAIVPVVLINPIDLDGSTVSRVSGYNYAMCLEKGIGIGAKVSIVKSGDIIPQIIEVSKKGDTSGIFPSTCPCGVSSSLVQRGPHLYCEDPSCNQSELKKFSAGITSLGIERIGGATAEKLFAMGYTDPVQLFDSNLFNEEEISRRGWKRGRSLDLLLEEVKKVTSIKLEDVIRSFGWLGVGDGISREVAKKFRGLPYDFSNKNRSVVDEFEEGTVRMNDITEKVTRLESFGVKIVDPVVESRDGKVKYCMTGKPTTHKYKADFSREISDYGYVEVDIKDADILITDDPDGDSSKMKKAKKAGIPIVTYNNIMETIGK